MGNNKIYFCLGLLLLLDGLLLFFIDRALGVSIGQIESFFDTRGFNGYLSKIGVAWFGESVFGFKSLFLLCHFVNAFLLFLFAKDFLNRPSDALSCVLLFLLLPGVNVDIAILLKGQVITLFVLFLCFLQQKQQRIPYWLLLIMSFIDQSFSLVFLALIFYGIAKKDTPLLFVSLLLFAFSMYLFGVPVGGVPKGYFVDTNGLLLLMFSPLIFLYFLYSLYRFYSVKDKPLIWYIAIIALGFIWLLSLRQKIDIFSFAPLLVVGLPLMVRLYFCGLRVRLPQFRMGYKIPFIITFIVLLVFVFGLFFGDPVMLFYRYYTFFDISFFVG